ncbi:MAG: CvpA family protein [Sphingomonadales bacterium]|nr:CvpA family protein [Sphingomonadales bacterium]
MTGFDITVLILVGLGAVMGFLRGFVHEVLALLAWVLAVAAIHLLHPALSAALLPYVHTTSGAWVLAFAILLLVPYGGTKLVANWLGSASRNSVIGPIDRVLGFGFGAVKGTVIVVLGFALLTLGYDIAWGKDGRPTWITESRTYPFINACSEKLLKVLAERRAEATAGKTDNADASPGALGDETSQPAAKKHRKHAAE